MLLRCIARRASFASSRGLDYDREVASRHHMGLLEKKHWELSTPSRSLSVLGVLARSGVFVDGLESAASHSLISMTPFMTSSERSMLKGVSSLFCASHRDDDEATAPSKPNQLIRGVVSSLSSSIQDDPSKRKASAWTHAQAEEMVLSVYAATCTGKGFAVVDPRQLDDTFYEVLDLPCSLMLLELIVSRPLGSKGVRGLPLEPLLGRVQSLLVSAAAQGHAAVEFRALWWLLMVAKGDPHWFRVRLPHSQNAALFTCCVRLIHEKLPSLSTEQLLLSYLALTANDNGGGGGGLCERPFIVEKEAERLIAETPPQAFRSVTTDTLLHFMATPFAEKQCVLWPKLCLGWYETAERIADMSSTQSRLALHILSRLHMKWGSSAMALAATRAEWQLLHDGLFAQIFVSASELSMAECVTVLEDSEIIHVSPVGTTAPSAFLKKMKNRALATMKAVVKRIDAQSHPLLSEDELASAYEAALRFEALLRRYALVPFSDEEANTVAQCVSKLCRHACRPRNRSGGQ